MKRPIPTQDLLESVGITLRPAPEVWTWVTDQILAHTGSIHNEDHAHLIDADIRVMWASAAFSKKGRTVVGQAEQVAFRAGGQTRPTVAKALSIAASQLGGSMPWPSVAVALANTVNGAFFSVPSAEPLKYVDMYRNDVGSAVFVGSYPSAEAVAVIDASGQANSEAVTALNRLIAPSAESPGTAEVGLLNILGDDEVSILARLTDKRLKTPGFDIAKDDAGVVRIKFDDGSLALLTDAERTIVGHLHAEYSDAPGVRVVDEMRGVRLNLSDPASFEKLVIRERPLDDQLLFSSVIATAADYDSTLYVPGILKRRELASLVHATVTSTTTAEAASGHTLPISAAKYGASATLSLRQPDEPDARLFMSLDLRNVPHQATPKAVKVLLIMDSIGNYQAAYFLKQFLEQMGFAPSFIGTVNGEGTTTSNGPLGECRPSWESGDFTHADIDMGAPVVAGEEAAYLAMSKTNKLNYNPFLRLAVGGDSVDLVRNGYVFDPAFYISRFGLETPDIVVNGMGTNDTRDKNPSIIYDTTYDNDRILHSQILAAWPAAKILRFVPPTSRTTARDSLWTSSYSELIRAFKKCATDLSSARITVAPIWAMVNVDGGYSLPTGTARGDGFVAGTYTDQIHSQGATRAGMFKALAPFIGAQILNII